MQHDTGAISRLMLAATLLIGVLGVSERALSHTRIRSSYATPNGNNKGIKSLPRIHTHQTSCAAGPALLRQVNAQRGQRAHYLRTTSNDAITHNARTTLSNS